MTKFVLTETRIAALRAARRSRLWPVGRSWRPRGSRGRGYDDRTLGPMVRAGFLADVCGTREITDAGRDWLNEMDERRSK